MKTLKFLTLALIFSGLTVFTACEKDENEDVKTVTVAEQLVSKWTGNEYYEDGVLSPYNELYKMSFIEFKTDGTGTSASPFGEQPLTWSYDSSTEKLRIETETVTDANDLTLEGAVFDNITILKIDNANLWYTYDDEGVEVEERYKK